MCYACLFLLVLRLLVQTSTELFGGYRSTHITSPPISKLFGEYRNTHITSPPIKNHEISVTILFIDFCQCTHIFWISTNGYYKDIADS